MKMKIVLIGMLALIAACQKEKANDNEPEIAKPVSKLLTQETWILLAHGFDDNMNGNIDTSENLISDCEKDNTYVFDPIGTGTYNDNTMKCGGADTTRFNWALINGDTKIQIDFETVSLLYVDEGKLVVSPDIPGMTVKYLLVYRH